jgi:hypothetical protein
MSILKRLFGNSNKSDKKLDLEKLLTSDNINNSIIAIDNFICELCNYGDNIEKLTEQQRNFYYNQNLEREVNNGGFRQYFYNSSGDFALETIESLNLIWATKTAAILQKAIDQFPGKIVQKDRIERRATLENIKLSADEVWEELDQMFFTYEDNLNALNIAYVRLNKGKF